VEPLPGFEGLVGQSASMQALFDQIQRVAPYDVPVLILGETGTGKELVATALHRLSRRRRASFEAVNCAALTRELLRSELFGHERGAFTGALGSRIGILREADGGTVFLDEVGELSLDAQAMLLRFLGHGEVRAVGASRAGHVDVRLIAATHRDLRAAVGEGRFREDVYYRLRRVVLEVPTLRARLDDLPLLVEHVRRQMIARHGLAIDCVTDGALDRLAGYPWPGNVRELEAVLEEAMLLRGGGPLHAEDLALRDLSPADRRKAMTATSAMRGPDTKTRWDLALALASEPTGVSTSELARTGGMGLALARRDLGRLLAAGMVRRTGSGRMMRYVRSGPEPS
jgi:two-component system, NtrC family, response regulator HydG